jgi:phage terminase Nu1 subunit (DNA packaging protein)
MMNQGAAAEKAHELHAAATDKATSDADLKAKIEAVRDARKTAREDLTKAQKELQELVTVRQEALLVAMGLLD